MKLAPDSLLLNQSRYALLNYSTPVKLVNLVKSRIYRRLRRSSVTAFPYRLIVDVTNTCNLTCPHCPTGKKVKGRPRGFMDLERFELILDQLGDYAYIIDLFNWGESLLHRELGRMIAMAEQRKVCTSVHTNLSLPLDGERIEDLVRSGLSYLSASLDGADQETYASYRKGGNLERALDNARRIVELRTRLGRRKPCLTWQFLEFPRNANQVEAARRLSVEAGFDRFVAIKGITGRDMQGLVDPGDRDVMKDLRNGVCGWLWTTATFHWDGKIGPCCRQFMSRDDFGDLACDDFMRVWNNENFRYARSLFNGQARAYREIICNRCYKVRRPP